MVARFKEESEEYRAFAAQRGRGRERSDPWTPDPTEIISKRRWEVRFGEWKCAIRTWADPAGDASNHEADFEAIEA